MGLCYSLVNFTKRRDANGIYLWRLNFLLQRLSLSVTKTCYFLFCPHLSLFLLIWHFLNWTVNTIFSVGSHHPHHLHHDTSPTTSSHHHDTSLLYGCRLFYHLGGKFQPFSAKKSGPSGQIHISIYYLRLTCATKSAWRRGDNNTAELSLSLMRACCLARLLWLLSDLY